ncbi:hypothetical protein [Thermococcus zilligii]|nr:hypothetical protein [Thermococcus zilligii]
MSLNGSGINGHDVEVGAMRGSPRIPGTPGEAGCRGPYKGGHGLPPE